MRLIYSRSALADLDKYYNWIAEDNPVGAEEWYSKMCKTCDALALKPRPGRPCEYASELNKIVEGNYFIYFTVGPDAVEIERIINRNRDQPSALQEE